MSSISKPDTLEALDALIRIASFHGDQTYSKFHEDVRLLADAVKSLEECRVELLKATKDLRSILRLKADKENYGSAL